MKKISLLILGIIFLIGIFYFKGFSNKSNNNQEAVESEFESLVSEQGGITFTATPLEIDSETIFEIAVDTHAGSLNFDLTQISVLEDDQGKKYEPIKWEGPVPGGHHMSGTLIFPELDKNAKSLKLTIQDAFSRIFEWDLSNFQ